MFNRILASSLASISATRRIFGGIASLTAVFVFLGLFSHFASAQEGTNVGALQKLGAKTRSEIAQLRGTAAHHALRVQTEGDRALREGDVVRAAEDYGCVEEEVRYLRAQRSRAIHARTLAHNGLERARRDGADIAEAERFQQRGDQALENGQYLDAQVDYAIANSEM